MAKFYSGNVECLKKAIGDEFSDRDIYQIQKGLSQLPLCRVSHSIKGSELLDKNYTPDTAPNGSQWVPVHADKEYSLEVRLAVGSTKSGKNHVRKAACPRFNKPVDETW